MLSRRATWCSLMTFDPISTSVVNQEHVPGDLFSSSFFFGGGGDKFLPEQVHGKSGMALHYKVQCKNGSNMRPNPHGIQSRDDDYVMNETRRKPTTGTRYPTL